MSTLYVIGIGPGDPELLTLKAVRIIRDVPLILVPKGREDGKSMALSIIERSLDLNEKKIVELHFPMIKTKGKREDIQERWDDLSKTLLENLRESDAAFITLGDPCFYSTFFYLHERLKRRMPELRIEIVPGVSSINAASAKASLPLALADEKIAIIPLNYFDFNESRIKDFDTIVFMKVEKGFNELFRFLKDHGLVEKSTYVSRVGLYGEKVITDISTITEKDIDYFSILIVKTQIQR